MGGQLPFFCELLLGLPQLLGHGRVPRREFLGGSRHAILRLGAKPELIAQVLVVGIDNVPAQPRLNDEFGDGQLARGRAKGRAGQ